MSVHSLESVHSPEHPRIALENQLTRFFLWLALVQLRVTAAPQALREAEEYAKQQRPIIYSVAPHTGHTDSLIVHEGIRQLLPSQLPHLLLVAAMDTWSSAAKRSFAHALLGELFLFDRQGGVVAMKELISVLSDRMTAAPPNIGASPVIYPQGTRNPGAPINDLPAVIAHRTKAPIAVLKICGAEHVLPKVPKEEQRKQIVNLLLRRIRLDTRLETPVTLELVDFIPNDLPRTQLKERFFAAHQK